MRALKVYLDGKHWVDIPFGKTESKELEAGSHTIRITNTLYAKKVEFEIEPGQEIRFAMGNLLPSIWATFLVLLGIVPYRVFLERQADQA